MVFVCSAVRSAFDQWNGDDVDPLLSLSHHHQQRQRRPPRTHRRLVDSCNLVGIAAVFCGKLCAAGLWRHSCSSGGLVSGIRTVVFDLYIDANVDSALGGEYQEEEAKAKEEMMKKMKKGKCKDSLQIVKEQ